MPLDSFLPLPWNFAQKTVEIMGAKSFIGYGIVSALTGFKFFDLNMTQVVLSI